MAHPVVRSIVGTAAVVGLASAGTIGGWSSWIVVTFVATLGYRRAVQAYALAYLLTMGNPNLFATADAAPLFRWVVLAAAFASVHLRWFFERRAVPRLWWATLAWATSIVVFAWWTSDLPILSTFKAASWWMAVSMLILAFRGSMSRTAGWDAWFAGWFVTVVVGSLPLYPVPAGYLHSSSGFMGLFDHPQTYTVFLAPFLAWWTLALVRRGDRLALRLGVGALAAASSYATLGRTGLAAGVAAIAVAYVWWVLRDRSLVSIVRGRRARVFAGAVTIVVASVTAVNATVVGDAVRDFLVKRGGVPVVESLIRSRGPLVERSWRNVVEAPMFGIGFGLPSDLSTTRIVREPIFGLPISAATEKGFAFLALLEETGIVGWTTFMALLLMVVRPLFARGVAIERIALACAAIAVNFGEAVLFAVGGSGALVWILLVWSRTGALADELERP